MIARASYANPQKYFFVFFFFILALSSLLRFFNLTNQGLIFYDEAAMVYRAHQFIEFFNQPDAAPALRASVFDTKVLWILTLVLFFKSCLVNYTTVHILSAAFGLLTIITAFIFALKYYGSRAAALFTAALLAICSSHVFYSRLALPESMATFLVLICFLFYLFSQRGQRGFVYLAGLFGALAFLTIRWRVILLPLMILLMEWDCYYPKGGFPVAGRWRFTKFLLMLAGILLFYEAVLHIVNKQLAWPLPSYFESLGMNAQEHRWVWPSLWSFMTYPFYLLESEGLLMAALFFMGGFFLRHKPSTRLPFSFVLLQMLVSSLMDEKTARSLSVVLPFVAMTAAVVLLNLRDLFHRLKWKIAYPVVVAAVIASGLSFSVLVLFFRSDYRAASRWIEDTYTDSRILTVNPYNTILYSSDATVAVYSINSLEDLQAFHAKGYQTILVGPQKFIKKPNLEQEMEGSSPYFIERIEQICQPVKKFPHFTPILMKRFLFEHTNPDLPDLQRVLGSLNARSGQLMIYDIDSCLQELQRSTEIPSQKLYEVFVFYPDKAPEKKVFRQQGPKTR